MPVEMTRDDVRTMIRDAVQGTPRTEEGQRGELWTFIREEVRAALSKNTQGREDHLTGMTREAGSDELADRQVDSRGRAQASWDQLSSGDQRRIIDDQVGQFERSGQRFKQALFRGELNSTSRHQVQPVTGWEALPWMQGRGEGMEGFGQGHHFAGAVLLMARAKANGVGVRDLIRSLSARGELHNEGLTRLLEERWHERTVQAGDATSGGWIIEEEVAADYIPPLYARSVVLRSGVLTVDLSRGMLKIPKQTGSGTFYWVGENGAITTSQITGGEITLTARKGGMLVPLSNDWIRRADGRANQIVTNDMLRIGTLGRDLGFLRGAGASFEPDGLINQAGHTIDAATAGTTDLDDAYTDIFAAQFRVHNANVMIERPAWYMSVREEFGFKQLRDGNNHLVFLAEMLTGNFMGAPFYSTTQIPTNLDTSGGANNDESDLYYVETSQIVVGITLGMTVEFFDAASYNDGSSDRHGVQRDESVARLLTEVDIKARNEEGIAVVRETTRGNNLD